MNWTKTLTRYWWCLPAALVTHAAAAQAATGAADRQPLNLTAISLFILFVVSTLVITWWAAQRTRSRGEFYAAAGRITISFFMQDLLAEGPSPG